MDSFLARAASSAYSFFVCVLQNQVYSPLYNGVWTGFPESTLHWPGLFSAKPSQLHVEVLLLVSFPSEGFREDVIRATGTIMPRHSMRITGWGSGSMILFQLEWG